MTEDPRQLILEAFAQDRRLAYRTLFAHRHPDKTPPFHSEILDLWLSNEPFALVKAFRGGAKSTLSEEFAILEPIFETFKFGLIIGNTYDRACERLAAIKHEFETNKALIETFGSMVGPTWAANEIVLANGAKIQAFGARQSLRGAKHFEARPDFALIDDLEDEDNVATEDARRKMMRWVMAGLLPAMDPHKGRVRMVGTPLHPQSALEELSRKTQWKSRVFPISYVDPNTGEDMATWPERFPLQWVNDKRDSYRESGRMTEFMQEYMCVSEDIDAKPFKSSMFSYAPSPRWAPTYVMVDPARSVKSTSARTGYAVWSWVGNKLHVLEGFGGLHKPDEIIDTIFRLDEQYNPVKIGVELDGLEEFIAQPLRLAQLDRHKSLPIVGVRAPKDKKGFITSLQPRFVAGEITFEKRLPELEAELLEFPTGRIDIPNALAYAPRLRGGKPVYEDFSVDNVGDIEFRDRVPLWLLLSSRPAKSAGVLVQFSEGILRVYADWVIEGAPGDSLEVLLQSAKAEAGREMKCAAPAEQFDKYTNTGLVAAAKKLVMDVRKSAPAVSSVGALGNMLRQRVRGAPAVMISSSARWTLNAMAGGYCFPADKAGAISNYPEDGNYKMVAESLETFVRWMTSFGVDSEKGNTVNYQYTKDGRRYMSAYGGRYGS